MTQKTSHFGHFEVRELLQLTSGLNFFHYGPIPPGPGMEAESLDASLRVTGNSDLRALAKKLSGELKNSEPTVVVSFIGDPQEKMIRVEIKNAEEAFGDLKPHHFQAAQRIEQALVAKGKKEGFL